MNIIVMIVGYVFIAWFFNTPYMKGENNEERAAVKRAKKALKEANKRSKEKCA